MANFKPSMGPILHNTITKFRTHLEQLLEDIKLEEDDYTLALYFDTVYLQRAALGYKDYYFDDDDTFKVDKFNNDITLICSLLSGGFIGQFRLLPPHQNEFLNKINSNFDGTNYEHWRDEVNAFVKDAKLDLSAGDSLSQLLKSENDEELVAQFTEYIETTKRGFNISHCLLPWDRRLTGWERKKLLVIEDRLPDYDSIFSSKNFHALKDAMDKHRPHRISNFIDATALSILIELTRDFKEQKSKLVPRFFLPTGKRTLFRDVLNETELMSQLKYSFQQRESSVLRNEEYFFYRSFFRMKSSKGKTGPEWGEAQLQELYEEATAIIERAESIETFEFDDKPLQEIIDGIENYSFLKNVWIEFINSGDLKHVLGDLKSIRRQFEEAKQTYDDISFAEQIRTELRKTRKNIFDNLDEVKSASFLWEIVNKRVSELRSKLSESGWDADALFINRKLLRYGFPKESHKEIKEYLSLLLSLETEAEFTRKAIGKLVSEFMKARSLEEPENQDRLIVITAILCALDLKDKIKSLLERPKKKINLHYSLKIALAGAEMELNNYSKGKSLIEDLEKEYYKDGTSSAVQCELAIGLTYLYYYSWLARRRTVERDDRPARESSEVHQEITRLINHAVVFAERATTLAAHRPLPQRVYAYNQYLFCLVESEDPENNKKMRNFAPKLIEYRDQADIWSYMYSDTLSRYFRWRANEQQDENQKGLFLKEALALSDEALALAANDEEVKKFHAKLIDETDPVPVDAAV
jgi:hypothetical protein